MADDSDNAQPAIESALNLALSRRVRVSELPANPEPYCDRCGELIGEARKAAMPSALYCIECETARSRRNG